MILITGGAWQGKKAFALALTGKDEDAVMDGEICTEEVLYEAEILDHLEAYLRRFPEAGADAERFADRLMKENPEVVLITKELGCGIVPMDPEDRAWRERCGRCSVALASGCSKVYRVALGIGTLLKP